MINCNIPSLFSENEEIIKYWKILSYFDRPPGFSGLTKISSKSIRDFCEDYDLDWNIYEMILFFEQNFTSKYFEIEEEKEKKQK